MVIILVLGGTGFVGRHVVAALATRGHAVVVGTRHPLRYCVEDPARVATTFVRVGFEALTEPEAWHPLIARVDVVVNCVGILRERGHGTYERLHVRAPAALSLACAQHRMRLVHVSALGLCATARSRFIRSKLNGERAIAASGAASTIVRPSLLDGDGGYGARWLRRVARWPIHLVPSDSTGRIAVLDVRDLGEAIALLCEADASDGSLVIELGGETQCTMAEYLAALRAASGAPRAACLRVPAVVARMASHLCDLLHFSPFSFGHLELLRRDNVPSRNALADLLQRPPRAVVGTSGPARTNSSSSSPRSDDPSGSSSPRRRGPSVFAPVAEQESLGPRLRGGDS
jgi:uncharacterized protein YbjT (DUF2867 family)